MGFKTTKKAFKKAAIILTHGYIIAELLIELHFLTGPKQHSAFTLGSLQYKKCGTSKAPFRDMSSLAEFSLHLVQGQ